MIFFTHVRPVYLSTSKKGVLARCVHRLYLSLCSAFQIVLFSAVRKDLWQYERPFSNNILSVDSAANLLYINIQQIFNMVMIMTSGTQSVCGEVNREKNAVRDVTLMGDTSSRDRQIRRRIYFNTKFPT